MTAFALGLTIITTFPAQAAEMQHPREGDVELHDFVFQNGTRLTTLKLHYTTLGTPQRNAAGKITNAVLLLHGTEATGKAFLNPTLAGALFQPGQPLDAQRYYIILPDGIGFGGSTKPSDGLQAHFPHYGYIDQVESQHLMLGHMGIDHLRLVAGISQGGMETWIWGERFPTAMDALVPIETMPTPISGRNLFWRQIIISAIKNDPGWNGGFYDQAHPPTAWRQIAGPLHLLMVGNPERIQLSAPDRAKSLAFYDEQANEYRIHDANDSLYDFESPFDYNPAPDIAKIQAPMLAINFADDEVNPEQLTPLMRQTIAKIPRARFVLITTDGVGYGHASISQGGLWAHYLVAFLQHLSSPS
jgi:homoserine O-acetyltransferase